MTCRYLQAGCLLLALLAACAPAAARPQQYDPDRYEPSPGGPSYDGPRYEYDAPEHDPEPYYQHSDEHYEHYDGHVEGKTLLLQETDRTVSLDPLTFKEIVTYKFRCAKERDAADVCLHPEKGDYYTPGDGFENSVLDSIMAEEAARCVVQHLDVSCPAAITTDCVAMELNCTISKAAEKCGCPYSEGFAFTAAGYLFTVTGAESCEAEYWPVPNGQRAAKKAAVTDYAYSHANATIYTRDGDVLVAAADYIEAPYGYKEAKLKLQFIEALFDSKAKSGGLLDRLMASRKKSKQAAQGVQAHMAYQKPPVYSPLTKEQEALAEEREEMKRYGGYEGREHYHHHDRHHHHDDHHNSYDSYDSYSRHQQQGEYYPEEQHEEEAYYSHADHQHGRLYKGGSLKITLLEKYY